MMVERQRDGSRARAADTSPVRGMATEDLLRHDPERFVALLREALQRPLPGLEAQRAMAPRHRRLTPEAGVVPRTAAVLVPLFPDDEGVSLLLTRRAATLRHHGGEISFPGGGWEEGDTTLAATALREAQEEIGLPGSSVDLLGSLTPLYVPPSRNCVHPFVGWIGQLPPLRYNRAEVAQLLRVPLVACLRPNARQERTWWRDGRRYQAPGYGVNGFYIWGATAMVLSELLAVIRRIGEERP